MQQQLPDFAQYEERLPTGLPVPSVISSDASEAFGNSVSIEGVPPLHSPPQHAA